MAAINYKISVKFDSDFNTFKINSNTQIYVLLHKSDGSTIDVTDSPDVSIYALDEDVLFFDETAKTLHFNKEGTGLLKVLFTDEQDKLFIASQEFVCYDTFFVDNYLTHFMTSFDAMQLQASGSKLALIIMDTTMELLDIFYAYIKDIDVIDSFKDGKGKFLETLAQNVGFERIDMESVNTPEEVKSSAVFKELLSNIFDLMEIRGTLLSYELFFGALGYNIKIEEFWYDEDGFLIEIDPREDSSSSFFRYNQFGTLVDDPPVRQPDPRNFVNAEKNIFRNNKSNIIRAILTPKDENLAQNPGTFSRAKKKIIKEYLKFLQPLHLEYIQELISFGINTDAIGDILNQVDSIDYFALLNKTITEEILNVTLIEMFLIAKERKIALEEIGFMSRWNTPNLVWNETSIKWNTKRVLIDNFLATKVAL